MFNRWCSNAYRELAFQQDGAVAMLMRSYDTSVRSLVGERTDPSETYWRGVDPARLLTQFCCML